MPNDALKILIVDDYADFADALKIQLEHSGRKAITAQSVRQALDVLDEDPSIGIVVTDIRMPGVDGMDFRRVLKHRFPKLPVVFMTGLPIDDDEVVPAHAAFLQKPFSVEALIKAIDGLE
jgi:DNA-binding NtrC family response regulator